MKLHLPVKLRSAVLSCMAVLSTIGTTVVTATMTGGAFALVVSSAAFAEELTLDADTTWQIGENHSQDTTIVNGVTLTVSGTAADNSTNYDFGDITVANGGKLVLPNSPGEGNASDSANAVGPDNKLQEATDITLNGGTINFNGGSRYFKNGLTIEGTGNKITSQYSKSVDIKSLSGTDAELTFEVTRCEDSSWETWNLFRVLEDGASADDRFSGTINLVNTSAQAAVNLLGTENSFADSTINIQSNGVTTRLLLGTATVNVANLTGNGSVEIAPQTYLPTSGTGALTPPAASTLVVSAGSGVYTGSFGNNVSLDLTGGSLTLQGQALDATRISVAAGATLTLDGVTLDGTSLLGDGHYEFAGDVTLTGDFGTLTDGLVIFAGADVSVATGTSFSLANVPVGADATLQYLEGRGLVVSLSATTLSFDVYTDATGTYDILYTKDLGATISSSGDKQYTVDYNNTAGAAQIVGTMQNSNLIVVGASAIAAMPEQGMTLKVTSGTYQGLSFARLNNTTQGTLGTADEKAQLNLIVSGSASVDKFIDGGQGLLGWAGGNTNAVFNSDITATVDTSGNIAWLNLSGEANDLNKLIINGDLVANITSGTVAADAEGEKASLAAGAKGISINGNSTFTIGTVGEEGPTLLGSVVGGIVQRDGGPTGSMTGDVTININSGSIAGNIYAAGAKATLNGNYTVNYSGGTLGGQIAVTAGGTVTGIKTLNICGSAVLDTTQFEYSKFDKVTVAENALLNMVGDVNFGGPEVENNGTIDFAGVTSVALDLTGLTGSEEVLDGGSTISAQYVVLEGGTLTNTDTLSALNSSFSYVEGKLIYSATVDVNGWDVNWGVAGLTDAPELTTLPVVNTITETTYLGADTAYINDNGDVQIRVTGSGDTKVSLYGGKPNTAFTGDTWLSIEGGTWNTIVGGTHSDTTQASFTGSSHILIGGATVDHVYGGIHADAGSPVMTGNTYVSIKEGSVINGWIAGGNVSWHNSTTKLVGNTNVWVYEVLTGEMQPSNQNGPASANTAVIGGNAWLRNTVCNSSIDGSTNVNILLGADAANGVDSPTFGKIIVGGSLIGSSGGSSTGSISGSTNLTIDTTDCTKKVTFSKNIIGGTFLTGSGTSVTYTQGGGSNMSIAGSNSSFDGMVILGCYVSNSQSATISGKSTLTIDGGTFSGLIIGGMYESTGSSTVVSGDIDLDLNSGTFNGDIVGGHYTTGNGTTALKQGSTGDVNITLGGGAVVKGDIYGGTILQRKAGATNVLTQGNINIEIEAKATIEGDIYAAGGDAVGQAATSVLTTASTRVAIANDVTFTAGKVISGGYIGMGSSPTSVINGDRTLALTGTGPYDLSSVTLKDFNTIEVTNQAASLNMGEKVTLASVGIERKTGAGTYLLLEGDVADKLNVVEGTLKLSSSATIGSLVVSEGAVLDATNSAAIDADISLNDGASLLLGSTALSLTGADNSLSLGRDLVLKVSGVNADSDVELIDGLSSVLLGDSQMDANGSWVSASDYFSSVVLGDAAIDNALIKLDGDKLILTDAKNAELYWEGTSGGNWSDRAWAATKGGTDVGSFLNGTQVFFTDNTQTENVLVNQGATAYDLNIAGDYSFVDAGGSLTVTHELKVSESAKADFGFNVGLSEATVNVEQGSILSLTGDTTVNALQNAGEVAVAGALTITSDTASTGSLEVSGDLTLTDNTNSFGALAVSGAVNTKGAIQLTANDSASSIGSLNGASVIATASHNLTLTTGASTLTSLSMADGSSLMLESGATLSVVSIAGGGRIDVTFGNSLNGTDTQLTLGGLAAGTTLNFTDATKDTFDALFAGGASSVVLAQLSDGAVIEGGFLLSGSESIGTDDGNIYKVVAGENSVYVYYAHSGFVWVSSGDSVAWTNDSAWDVTQAPTGTDNVVFNGQGSSTVVLDGAVANNVYIESEDATKGYTFTGGSLDAAGSIYVTSGSLTIGEGAEVTAAGVEVTTGSLAVGGSLDAGKMVGNQVTLNDQGKLTLGDASDVEKVLSAAGANGTLLAVSDGMASVGSATVGGVHVAEGATLQAFTLTLTGTNSVASGTVNAEKLAVTVGGSSLGALNAGSLEFSDIGAAGAETAVLEVDSISSLSTQTAVQVDFSGLNVSEDGVYKLVHSQNALGADFTLAEGAVQYLSTLRFNAVLDSTSDANTVSLSLRTLDDMVWRTASDTDSSGFYVIPLDGADMYEGLEPIRYVAVNGDKTLDYTQADPETSAAVPSLGAVVRNMSGFAGYTLTFVGDGIDADRVTFVNDADDVAEGAHTIAGENITLQVGATADEFSQMHTNGILTDEDSSENHALTVGGVDLKSAALVVRDENGVKFTTGVLNGNTASSVSGTIHINGAGGKYEGSGSDATIVLEQGADQLFTQAAGIVLTGSAGTARVDGGELGGLATTGADLVLVAPGEDENVEPVKLVQASSMKGGSLTATVDSAKVFAGEGDQTALFTGAALALNGTHLVLNSDAGTASMVADVDLSKTDGFVITNLHTDDASGSAEGATVTISGGVLNKYFGNATVQGNQVLASRNAGYYSESLAPLSPNGNAGLSIADGALLYINPQNDRTNYRDLAGVLDSLDAHVAAGDSLGADRLASQLAGAEVAGMGMAFSNDMDRQLRAIRNRTTTMGVNEAYINPDMPYFNAWVNAEGDYQQVKRDAMAPGFTLSSWGGTLGADVDFNEHVTAGLAVTAMYGDFSSESVGMAEGDLDTYYVTAFARYSPDSPWVHTFVASVGMADASLKRTVTHANGSYTAEGDTTGMGFGLLYEVGYTIALNEDATSCLQPVFNISYVHTELDGYRESGSDAALNFGNQKMDSFTLGLGARWQALVGENIYNRTSMFESRALLKFTSGDRSSSLHSSLASGVGNRATIKSEEQGAIGVELGAGLSVPLGAEAGTLFIDGSLEAYTSYTNVNATVGWRINF